MTHREWLALMKFPREWTEWGLLPDALIAIQLSGYRPGHEEASEHNRHGAFQWWLRQNPPKSVLLKLARLTWLDPDPLMAQYVRDSIASKAEVDAELERALNEPYAP